MEKSWNFVSIIRFLSISEYILQNVFFVICVSFLAWYLDYWWLHHHVPEFFYMKTF